MAQRGPPRSLTRKETIADLSKDLELLQVDSKDYGETMDSMAKARDLRIKELEKRNGTLLKVWFSYVLKTFHFKFDKSRQENKYAADIRTWRTICPRCNIAGTDLLRSQSRWFQQL